MLSGLRRRVSCYFNPRLLNPELIAHLLGESYSAGDVLLEIETDKATMDVEAQDDGIVYKILVQDGSKGIKVGARIGVMAEEGDDLSSLELPADAAASQKAESPKAESPEQSSEPKVESKKGSAGPEQASAAELPSAQVKMPKEKQRYPLYPSVAQLLREKGLSKDDADKIPTSGPNGRLLKGDVLAYMGRIEKSYPSKLQERLVKLGHLDLSNITLATPKSQALPPAAKAAEPEIPKETEIALPISLSGVIATQKRVQDALGIFLPLSTFIARASEMANEDLPASAAKPSSTDLFNAVLGLKTAPKMSRGNFIPNITGLSPAPSARPVKAAKKTDILDVLISKRAVGGKKAVPSASTPVGISTGPNVFSVSTPRGDEKRATQYLERMKQVLEAEPGRLVI